MQESQEQVQEQGQVPQAQAQEAQAEQVEEDTSLLNSREREEIRLLSKMFFGSSSKWQKLTTKGASVQKVDAEGKPVRGQYEVRYSSERGLLSQLRNVKAQMDAEQEQRRLAREAAKAAEVASGSAE